MVIALTEVTKMTKRFRLLWLPEMTENQINDDNPNDQKAFIVMVMGHSQQNKIPMITQTTKAFRASLLPSPR